MMKQLEATITSFASLALACAFGLALTIGAAGLSKSCSPCMPTLADTLAKRV